MINRRNPCKANSLIETPKNSLRRGFTLIEISIVLVIIGLITGGILVGQDLIKSAEIRSTISQLEKYNTAVHTFQNKYGYLPGDIPDPLATNAGFATRAASRGQGDGNGLLEGWWGGTIPGNVFLAGELIMFWEDLYRAGLIDSKFNSASNLALAGIPTASTNPAISDYMPLAKLGNGNYFYVRSQPSASFCGSVCINNGINFFGLGSISYADAHGNLTSTPTLSLSVKQAYAIDSKIDDGLPQSGSVTAQFAAANNNIYWASGTASSGTYGTSDTSVTAPSSTTCYDNGGNGGTQQYSMGQNNGTGMNCALSFKMQ